MNKEVVKAINKKSVEQSKISKWWSKNSYIIYRIIFFPLWLGILIKDEINSYLNSKQVWNDERANEILNYYIPRRSHWDKEKKQFYLFDNGLGWNLSLAKKILKRKDYRFWNCNAPTIRRYLINTFELEGFTKEILMDSDWTEMTFTMKED